MGNNNAIEEEKNDGDNSNSLNIKIRQENQLVEKSNINFYERFSKFVRDNKISRDDFCRPIHFVLPMDEFALCFKTISFPISNEEVY